MKRFFALALLGLVAFIGCAAEEGGAPAPAPDAGATAAPDANMDAAATDVTAPADAGATAPEATPAESPAP